MGFKSLGLNIPDLKKSARPFTERGKGRKILDVGQMTGDFEKFLESRGAKYQLEFLGPNRLRLWKEGKINVNDLADKDGKERRLKKNKDGEYIGLM